ncbi:MAG: hypothetical protein KKB20_01270 [Proteobacteria bacterium]|nr:hypothetical protein [Pseudomonadota bacterium]
MTSHKVWILALALAASLVCLSGCRAFRYSVVDDYRDRPGVRDGLNCALKFGPAGRDRAEALRTEPDCLFFTMASSPDPRLRDLGRALARLPDVNHGPVPARALAEIYGLAREADPARWTVLSALAAENPGPDQFGGSLQGLLWMTEQGPVSGRTLVRLGPAGLLDYAWQTLPGRLKSPARVLDFLAGNFSYQPDRYQARGKREFFRDKYGDCTEFTLLGGYLLGRLGLDVQVLLTRPMAFMGHISLIFRDRRGYWLLDASRAAILRSMARKGGPRGPVDRFLLPQMQGFDRILGPAADPEALVEHYRQGGRTMVPFRLLAFAGYQRVIEALGREDGQWWDF